MNLDASLVTLKCPNDMLSQLVRSATFDFGCNCPKCYLYSLTKDRANQSSSQSMNNLRCFVSFLLLLVLTGSASAQSWTWTLNRHWSRFRLARVFESNMAISVAWQSYQLINLTDGTVSIGDIDFIEGDRPVEDAFEFSDGSIQCMYFSRQKNEYYLFKVTSSGVEKPMLLPVGKDAILAGVLDKRFLVFSEESHFVAIDCVATNARGDLSIKKVAKPEAVKSKSLACVVIPGTHNLVDIISRDDDNEVVVVFDCNLAHETITAIARWDALYKGTYNCLSLSRDEVAGKHFVWTLGKDSFWPEQRVALTGEIVRGIDEPALRKGGTRPPGYISVWDNGATLEVTNYRRENFGHFDLESDVKLIELKSNETLLGRIQLGDKTFRVAYSYMEKAQTPITVVDESNGGLVSRIEMANGTLPYLVEGPNGTAYLFGSEFKVLFRMNNSDGTLTKVVLTDALDKK